MYKYSKFTLKIFFISIAVIFTYIIASVYIYDPLQIWHTPFFRKITYQDNLRESAFAMIRDNNFDSIIMGNSHSANTSSKEAGQKLNGEFFNFSVTGSTVYEKKLFLNYILAQKHIKRVLYFIDTNYMDQAKDNMGYLTSRYSFLYDNKKYNNYKIYLNYKYLNCSLLQLQSESCIGKKLNMDKPTEWETDKEFTRRFGGFQNWEKYKNDPQMQETFLRVTSVPLNINHKEVSPDNKSKIIKYLYDNIIVVVKNNPNTEFDLIFPPVSNLELARMIRNEEQSFAKQEVAIRYLVSKSQIYKNLKIYAFDDSPTIGKIEDFKDRTHFNPWVNSYILNEIKNNKNIISQDNVQKYLDDIHKKAVSVDYYYYFNRIEQNQ